MLRCCLYIPLSLLLPVSTLSMLLFCVWVLPGNPCSSKQASWHFCFISHSLIWIWPWKKGSLNINQLSWASLPCRMLSHRTLKKVLEEARVCSPVVKHCNLAFCPTLSSQDPDTKRQLVSTELSTPSKIVLNGQDLCCKTNSFAN